MIKNILLTFLSFSVYATGRAQTNNRILYVLPDSVEVAASVYFQHITGTAAANQFYCLLATEGNDTCAITISRYEERAKTIVNRWLSHSNRSVIINKTEYPLLTDLDFRFGLPDEKNIGQMGKRDGMIGKVEAIPHRAYTIIFKTDNGKVLRIEQD